MDQRWPNGGAKPATLAYVSTKIRERNSEITGGRLVGDQLFPVMNRQDHLKFLDSLYDEVKKVVLNKQHPVSGLLPASTAITTHGNYTDAWVRDNVYSILCVWGLGLAYRKIEDSPARTHELEQSTVKCFRGLLTAMMKQANKVETFKHHPHPLNSLHAKYNTANGDTVVGDHEWGHLQLDATSIFLFYLAQMTRSGLKIVYTFDEVDFVQNLVYYIEESYSTPDYGIWERGNKSNHGQPELNASSIGMAQAAMEACSNLDLFGTNGTPESTIHTSADEIARCSATLTALLPRESASKEIDSALMSVIGFPAFAVQDKNLVDQTRRDIVEKLGGRYGFKRFLRDGHQAANEDASRLYYEPWELKKFEHVECEWPLFFCYMVLDGVYSNNQSQVDEYLKRLEESCLVESDGIKCVPELFFVPADRIEAEQADPGSQTRVPNDNLPLVWAQSLYVLGRLLASRVLSKEDIDPLMRWKGVGKIPREPVVQVVVVAEDDDVKEELSEVGVVAETPYDLYPAEIRRASDLGLLYQQLGANAKLGLTGRPDRRIRSLSTARFYVVEGRHYIFISPIHDSLDSYLPLDHHYFVDSLAAEMAFLRTHFKAQGRPTITLLITKHIMQRGRNSVLQMMRLMKEGRYNDTTVNLGTFRELLLTASVRKVSYTSGQTVATIFNMPRSSSILGLKKHYLPDEGRPTGLRRVESATRNLLDMLQNTVELDEQLSILKRLIPTRGLDFNTEYESDGLVITLKDLLTEVYEKAARIQDWRTIREASTLMKQSPTDLPDHVMDLLVRQFQLVIGGGFYDRDEAVVTNVNTKADNFLTQVTSNIARVADTDPVQRHLAYELIISLATISKEAPELMDNIARLSLFDILSALAVVRDRASLRDQSLQPLANCNGRGRSGSLLSPGLSPAFNARGGLCVGSPAPQLSWSLTDEGSDGSDNAARMDDTVSTELRTRLLAMTPYELKNMMMFALTVSMDAEAALRYSIGWADFRVMRALLGRVPAGFFPIIWQLLDRCREGGVVVTTDNDRVNECRLPAQPTVAEMTAQEKNFELCVFSFLNGLRCRPLFMALLLEAVVAISECITAASYEIHDWIDLRAVLCCVADVHRGVRSSTDEPGLGWAQAELVKTKPIEEELQRWSLLASVSPNDLHMLISACIAAPNSTSDEHPPINQLSRSYANDRPSFFEPSYFDACRRYCKARWGDDCALPAVEEPLGESLSPPATMTRVISTGIYGCPMAAPQGDAAGHQGQVEGSNGAEGEVATFAGSVSPSLTDDEGFQLVQSSE